MLDRKIKPIAVAVGAVFAAALATASVAETDGALFAVEELDRGYDRLADQHGEDGSCGDDKADGEKEGSCGDDKADGEKEGSCGEGKCGDASSDD